MAFDEVKTLPPIYNNIYSVNNITFSYFENVK